MTMIRAMAVIGLMALAGCGARSYGMAMSAGNDPATLTRIVSNATTTSRSGQHGTQVEYLSADGRSFLWYPGNRALVPGQWKVEGRGGSAQMCFRYTSDSFNPATGQIGGGWDCRFGGAYLVDQYEILDGDPFGLSDGKVPFVMPRDAWWTGADLAKRLGLSQDAIRQRLENPML